MENPIEKKGSPIWWEKKATRRSFLKGSEAWGLGLAATSIDEETGVLRAKGPIELSFWTWQNPQQHAWIRNG